MDKFQNAAAFIEKVIEKRKLEYFDITVFQKYRQIYRKTIKPETYGQRDKLYMYSCTKPLTAVCVMRLIEEGKLSLADRLTDYLPSFQNCWYQNEKGERQIVGNEITLRHLMTMTAGLSYDLDTPAINALLENGGQPTTIEMMNAIAQTPLVHRPGAQFTYSLCLDVMAAVVEIASGMRFADYVAENVFKPLGMHDSHFVDNDRERMIPVFEATAEGMRARPLGNGMVRSPNFDSGGAGLISTVEDYAKFGTVLANGGKSADGYVLLKPETIAQMTEEAVSIRDINSKFTCIQGDDYSYGLGVRTRIVDTPWGLTRGEFGWDGAAGSYLMVDPAKEICIVMGLHVMNWPMAFQGEHLAIVEKIYRAIEEV